MRRWLDLVRGSGRIRYTIVGLVSVLIIAGATQTIWNAAAARERAEIAAVLRARQQTLREGDRQAFLRFADPAPDWRRFLSVAWDRQFEPAGALQVLMIRPMGELRRVRARIGSEERVYLLRCVAGRWVTTEPTAAELGPWAQRTANLFRIHYHPRWDDEEVVSQLLAIGDEVALAVAVHVTLRPEPVDIFLDHRLADRQALGWDVITHRGVSRQREVHLWSPNSYGWGARASDTALQADLRQALATELLFILPGF